MASKGPRSRVDHETRAKRQKALEPPRDPPRPKTHWDVVLEEMVWLSKDFESERKWKLSQAKKVAIRASKSILEHATKGEKKVKEEEQRLRKVALNISKEIKKFWTKIEKLVIYKHQLECEERKKKALDKQLDFLLGQTERYSTMLAENLVDKHHSDSAVPKDHRIRPPCNSHKEMNEGAEVNSAAENPSDNMELDDEYGIQSEDVSEDDEHTIEEDEALITKEERREELAALQVEVDLPLEELLKRYNSNIVNMESFPDSSEDVDDPIIKWKDQIKDADNQANGSLCVDNLSRELELPKEMGDDIFNDEVIDATSISYNLQEKMQGNYSISKRKSRLKNSRAQWESLTFGNSDDLPVGSRDEGEDRDYMIAGEDEKDDETTLAEEEELAMEESNDPLDEVNLLQLESEIPIDELLSRYKQDAYSEEDSDAESCYTSSSSDGQSDHPAQEDIHCSDSENVYPSNIQKIDKTVQLYLKTETDQVIDGKSEVEKGTEDIIEDAAAAARSAQPTGNTFSTTKVCTKFPFLLKHPLREYQHIGLDWLVTMYEKRLNGILADEMGLGKTIMTISLLAHLACEKGIWGPHLIVVPTSVMLNWETEFLKWCPAFKILTYFGSAKERKQKRQGWLKPNSFHVCITTYRLVIQDSKVFKRKKWKYLILDEAHLIKNWKSQRWQTLLNFNSKRRILLTGTPLQNDLMELWSLMHFLMPHIFQSHQEFKDWFSNPITCMVEGQEKVNKDVVDRLHNVLRPFLLRRLKRDVEKQLPKKHEHVIYCRLSKRQRNLYEEFITSSETQATLASTNFFAMISVIMQLRKVCNHPDLFEGRPIVSSFDMAGIDLQLSSTVCSVLCAGPFSKIDLKGLNLIFTQLEFSMTSWEVDEIAAISAVHTISSNDDMCVYDKVKGSNRILDMRKVSGSKFFEEIQRAIWEQRMKEAKERAAAIAWWNSLRCQKKPVYGINLREIISVKHPVLDIHEQKNNPSCYMNFSSKLSDLVLLPVQRMQSILDLIECFMFAIPAARSPSPLCWSSKGNLPVFLPSARKEEYTRVFSPLLSPIRPAIVRRQVYFPDRRLIQFDCGKLQELAMLLRRLKSEGHRALIFTQMTKMLDILEAFINLYGYTYMRLDGSTQPEERQTLMQRFNTNPKFFLFILSTRSGGVGINLVGADTVIFYDSDWNPAMDQQAQDRCHRIGQTREVHIYRLISESTIEENILKKANQKRALDNLVIQSGSYNTEFFKKLNPAELFSGHQTLYIKDVSNANAVSVEGVIGGDGGFSNADVEAALKQAEDEADYMALKKVEEEEAVDNQEFTEDAIGREEDDLINDDDVKVDEISAEERGFQNSTVSKDAGPDLLEDKLREEKTLTLADKEEDIDMLADVKQLAAAAAAAAGEASSSFENQLRPIDRYAMRFLDLWDPIIDKSEVEYEAHAAEEEWELDRIQKFKEDLEAEIDEDEEPFLYERWDAEFATEAYKYHVEALAQQQLLEEKEREAYEASNAEDSNAGTVRANEAKPRKSKSKKSKKARLKSLKKKSVASDIEEKCDGADLELESNDEKDPFHDVSYLDSPSHISIKKKRKAVASDEENVSKKKMKKMKKPSEVFSAVNSDSSDKRSTEGKELKCIEGTTDVDLRTASRSKMGGKISITVMPIKRIMVVKPEKLKKKVNVWSKDCIPSPDIWSSQEDAVLCAVVHEYGAHWSLVSDVLYSISGGGFYRGRFRHPAHCCERFRDLFSRYILSTAEGPNAEKMNAFNSGKALLKVTEDQSDLLLNVASELSDTELLLQKHFMAVLSSVWRAKCRLGYRQNESCKRAFNQKNSSLHGYKSKGFIEKVHFAKLRQNGKIVAAALNEVLNAQQETFVTCNQQEAIPDFDQAELTLEFSNDLIEAACPFPLVVNLSIRSPDPPCTYEESSGSGSLKQFCRSLSEHRFRLAWENCLEGETHEWALSAFPTCDFGRPRSASKTHSVSKHKPFGDPGKSPKSKVPRTAESETFSSRHTLMTSSSPDSLDAAFFSDIHTLLDSDDSNNYHLADSLVSAPVTCEYDPNFIANLEDLNSLGDIPEVG